jgi:hypothetical protein
MKVYKKGNNGEFLMHSDIYLGEDYTSPNMMHYKYIKKERKNGRWVYYYDGSLDEQRNISKGEFEYGISKENRKRLQKGYVYKSPYDGKTYDYKHYRKALASDYTDYKKLDNQIKKSKAVAKALNTLEGLKMSHKKVAKSINKGINRLKKVFGIK